MSEVNHIHRHQYTHVVHEYFHKDCLECWERQRDELGSELDEAKEHITAYQLRVDNDSLRLKNAYALGNSE